MIKPKAIWLGSRGFLKKLLMGPTCHPHPSPLNSLPLPMISGPHLSSFSSSCYSLARSGAVEDLFLEAAVARPRGEARAGGGAHTRTADTRPGGGARTGTTQASQEAELACAQWRPARGRARTRVAEPCAGGGPPAAEHACADGEAAAWLGEGAGAGGERGGGPQLRSQRRRTWRRSRRWRTSAAVADHLQRRWMWRGGHDAVELDAGMRPRSWRR